MTDRGRALRDVAVLGALAWLFALGALVRDRNHAAEARTRAQASAAASAVAAGERPLAPVAAAGVVGPASQRPDRPFLRRRTVVDADGRRPLGGPTAPAVDKLLYDAAARFDRDGAFVALLPDGSGRAVAAVATPHGPAIAITAGAAPRSSVPWLALLGIAGLVFGAVAVAATVGGRRVRIVCVGVAVGLAALPVARWGGPIAAAVVAVLGALAGWAHARGALDRAIAGLRAHRIALGFLAPAAVAMVVLVVIPFVVGLALGFYDHHHGRWTFVGLSNFRRILTGDGHSLSDPLNFWFILGVTLLWTFANVLLHVGVGTAFALVLRQPWIKARGVWRALLIVPWAVPNYITALIWKSMFDVEYGAFNHLLAGLGLDRVSWFSEWSTSFAANVATNTWLGFPFMMVVALGALESIPKELEEAADVDGASAWQRFREITLPHLKPALGPAVILGSIWTFNMFNVIALVSAGRPRGSTDILVTDAYRWAFERGEQYGMAAALGTIIFLLLLAWSILGRSLTKGDEEARP
ncbi:MAG: sugar ABC transporter permease [Kofleriaceae bacterium]|jgi:ABC-type sugar transport system permease subunit|nr:sugar ABC transporter permease [Kofleriaceae bacterium]MBP9169178.1 sugar ABC transporter permease [Kofleriaceae bacterium]MBP9857871.1 sugar ABC transporter permease [Kofleriaceae bacterium]